MSIAAMGLNLTLGYAGQVSLAQGAFVGIGAYAAAILTTHGCAVRLGDDVAIALCFAVGWLLGYPALRVQPSLSRLRHPRLLDACVPGLPQRGMADRGRLGHQRRPAPIALRLCRCQCRSPYYYFCLAALGVVARATGGLVRSPWGRAFVALRENPLRAASLGVDTRRYTLLAFAIGSALGGLGGRALRAAGRVRRAARHSRSRCRSTS